MTGRMGGSIWRETVVLDPDYNDKMEIVVVRGESQGSGRILQLVIMTEENDAWCNPSLVDLEGVPAAASLALGGREGSMPGYPDLTVLTFGMDSAPREIVLRAAEATHEYRISE